MPDRNRVRIESNERIDKPDFEALQLGAHLAVRYLARGLLFGTDASDQTVVTSAWSLSTAGSELTITPGRAIAGETMADASVEQGHIVGEDGDTSQTLDFTGEPADTYFIYVRADFSAGVSGSRIFWNAATETEDSAAIDTREVSGWRAVKATSAPGTGYTQVGRVVWDGAAFTSVASSGLHFYEGLLTPAGVESGDQWGGGANDRNADRASYGVQSVFKAFALVRRQLKDIIGAASGHWGSAVPVSLTSAKTHIDTTTDPHGSAPTWTGKPTFQGGLTSEGEVDATGTGYVLVDGKTDIRFDDTQEGHYVVAGIACVSYVVSGTTANLGLTDGGNARLNNSGTGSLDLVVPLHIPHGATLTRVLVNAYWENQTGATATMSIVLWKHAFAFVLYVVDQMGTDTEDDTTVSGTSPSYGSCSVDGLSEVVGELDSFFVEISLDNNGETAKLSLVNVTADYEFDNVVG